MKTTNPPLPRVLGHAVLWGLLAAWPQTSGAVIRLVDVAARAGITLLNVCGGPSKDYIVEVNGNGAAFFDYDNVSKMSARSRSQRFEAAAVISRTTTCVRFGLGRRTSVPPMKVRWPDGAVERFEGLTRNRIHAIRQGSGRATPPDAR